MSIEEAMMGGIVFKGKKDKPKEENKVKTKAKKKTYITGLHGSGAAKMKAEIRKKRANRHKGKVKNIFQVKRCKFYQTEFTPFSLYLSIFIPENRYKIIQLKQKLAILR